jgi:hypothetical protein
MAVGVAQAVACLRVRYGDRLGLAAAAMAVAIIATRYGLGCVNSAWSTSCSTPRTRVPESLNRLASRAGAGAVTRRCGLDPSDEPSFSQPPAKFETGTAKPVLPSPDDDYSSPIKLVIPTQ